MMTLTQEEKALLLKIARASLESAVTGSPLQEFLGLPGKFKQDCGAFVSLHKAGELRGCIGYIMPISPLFETVVEMAKAAALHDNRFEPVISAELEEIDIEISVLTPPAPIKTLDEFVIGRHGIIISLEGRQAVFLPQVAVEQNWDKPTTLMHLCRKAGLPFDAYKRPEMQFKVFEAIVFGEKGRKG